MKLLKRLLDSRAEAGQQADPQEYRKVVAVDFDGTLAVTQFPEIIKPIPEMIRVCRKKKENGDILILWTCRAGKDLEDAVEWCRGQGLVFDHVNENVPEHVEFFGNDSRKIWAHEYIEDKAVNPERENMWRRERIRWIAITVMMLVFLAASLAS